MGKITKETEKLHKKLLELEAQVKRSVSADDAEKVRVSLNEIATKFYNMQGLASAEAMIEQISEVMPLIRAIISEAKDPISQLLDGFMTELIDVYETVLIKHLFKLDELEAKKLFNFYTTLVGAGFPQDIAIKIVLQNVKPINSITEFIQSTGGNIAKAMKQQGR